MSKKTQQDQPADDWAGLAQNLFGINLKNPTGDDDLLDEDMFKVELPKPPEPAPLVSQAEVEFAPAVESENLPVAAATSAVVVSKPPVKTAPPQRINKVTAASADDSFGFGILEDVAGPTEQVVECSAIGSIESEDDGLTLPDDFDPEGLTLPADYDDGLTLPLEGIAAGVPVTDSDGDAEDDEDGDTEVLVPGRGAEADAGRSEQTRRRHPRRTREDAYWDMLENWEWEEIPDHDAPRGEGERPRSQRGDRGGDRGNRGRRDRGRDERPRSESRSSTEQRASRDEPRSAEAVPGSGGEAGDRSRRPRRGDRPRDDRPRGARPPERGERSREEPRPAAMSGPPTGSQGSRSSAKSAADFEDFGSGIFDEQTPVEQTPSSAVQAEPPRRSRDESVAQSSRAPDAVVSDRTGLVDRSIDDELVWPDEDSDVRPAPASSVVETSGLPPAVAAGESDEMVVDSDVEPLNANDEAVRPRRRRRRRPPETRAGSRALPADGNEGTTFDLTEALAVDGESPDFIPSAASEDCAVSEETAVEGAVADARSSEPRVRRRRRRRRPGEGSVNEPSSGTGGELGNEGLAVENADRRDAEEFVVRPISYSNIPSWEEAIKFLLQPHLVGRNLGPDDGDESLQNDPRGSGGAEPTPPPPPPQRRGGGRGRRPSY